MGSGEVEAANNVLVTHRLKRSGQTLGRDGGQGGSVLSCATEI